MKNILFLFVALISAQMTFAQEGASTQSKDSVKVGSLDFEKTTHNFGEIKKGGDGTCVFVFINNSSTPAILSNVKSSCGCTTPSWPREPIAPGASSEIKVRYDTNRVGSFTKYINVFSNKSATPIRLTIMGKVIVQPTVPTGK